MSTPSTKTYRLGQVCELTGLAESRVRKYEALGLLEHVQRTDGRQRLYTDAHLERLRSIKRMREADMGLGDIRLALRVLTSNALGVEVDGLNRVLDLCASIHARVAVTEELTRALKQRALTHHMNSVGRG